MANGKAGRTTKLTEDLIEAICQHVERGHYYRVAAEACGIPAPTISKWINRGRQQPNSIYGRLRKRIQEASGLAEIAMVNRVLEAALTDPDHAWKWLERKHPERWGRNRLDLIKLQREVNELAKIVRGLHDQQPAENHQTNNGAAAGRLPGGS